MALLIPCIFCVAGLYTKRGGATVHPVVRWKFFNVFQGCPCARRAVHVYAVLAAHVRSAGIRVGQREETTKDRPYWRGTAEAEHDPRPRQRETAAREWTQRWRTVC